MVSFKTFEWNSITIDMDISNVVGNCKQKEYSFQRRRRR